MPDLTNDESIEIFKALSNPTRLAILEWLKDPKHTFDPIKQGDIDMDEVGVCVSQIREKSTINQSTVSQYLSMLQRVNLLQATRIGKWTYYKRNEAYIQEIKELISQSL
ncbi:MULTISPECIES: ArsR/SmtB family transcription factor [Staphylococcus]|uniref:ArsR/SmtB family transcription factor n=1 Tax=Staphylococcus TaxID=1279 RepID=UPI000D1C6306|nr:MULTISPECIES: metalloregulator ArsR/SmtB family transcription factor [Staphylococcus]MBI5973627.1 helix-turn-helix transcriptional regulator [Staphylococcus caledonicus]MCI2947159.1 helix-turn-helix domain-containing protein [Staphylococcus sp. acrmy]PTE66943.1 transcriptional regulator [Staphylococcus devriesei]